MLAHCCSKQNAPNKQDVDISLVDICKRSSWNQSIICSCSFLILLDMKFKFALFVSHWNQCKQCKHHPRNSPVRRFRLRYQTIRSRWLRNSPFFDQQHLCNGSQRHLVDLSLRFISQAGIVSITKLDPIPHPRVQEQSILNPDVARTECLQAISSGQ